MMIMEKLKVLLMEAKMMKVVKIEISNKKEMHNNSLVSISKKEMLKEDLMQDKQVTDPKKKESKDVKEEETDNRISSIMLKAAISRTQDKETLEEDSREVINSNSLVLSNMIQLNNMYSLQHRLIELLTMNTLHLMETVVVLSNITEIKHHYITPTKLIRKEKVELLQEEELSILQADKTQ